MTEPAAHEVSGILLAVEDGKYRDKKGELVDQVVAVFEGETRQRPLVVIIPDALLDAGIRPQLEALVGEHVVFAIESWLLKLDHVVEG